MQLHRVPFNDHLQFELTEAAGDRAVIRMPVQPWFAQEMGVVHGGVIASLADTAAVYAVLQALPPKTPMTSIEFKVNFLGAASPSGGDLVATATVVRRGRQVAVVSSSVAQGEKAIATGLFTYLILGS
jgi:uncharacterized protein (TIGR00369 family)